MLRRFLLIKEYPGSGILGTPQETGCESTIQWFLKYPEYWKEIDIIPKYVKCIDAYSSYYTKNNVYKVDDKGLVFGNDGNPFTLWNNNHAAYSKFISITEKEYNEYIKNIEDNKPIYSKNDLKKLTRSVLNECNYTHCAKDESCVEESIRMANLDKK